MSQRASWIAPLFGLLALSASPDTRAQTIDDYSRAQRAWLQSAISQSTARSAGAGASPAATTASAPPGAARVTPRSPNVGAFPTPTMRAIQVSGVFKSATRAVAEVVVNATAYLLEVGQAVPGTPWQVDAVAVDHVVLTRRGGAGAADGQGMRKVVALPPLH